MTTPEMLRRIRSAWKEEAGGFYLAGTTTSAGNAGGTTLVATGLTALDDFYNQKEVLLTSGSASGQRRLISDFDAASDTITVEETFGWQVASGVTFELGEKGFWSDREILDWLNDSLDDIMSKLSDEVLFRTMNKTASLTISSGVATMPADFLRMPAERDYVTVDSRVAPILNEYERFLYDSFLQYKAIFRNATLEYRPTSAAAVVMEYIKKPTAMTISAASDLPADLHQAQCDYAIYRGWMKAQTQVAQALSAKYFSAYTQKIEAFNQQWAGKII